MPLRLKDQIYATVNSDAAYNGSYKLTFPNKAGTIALTSDLPTVNNATLTIQKNGANVTTFTANASSNATANITVPINVSDLTNDAGYLTSVAWGDVTGKPTFATVATSGSYNDLSNKPTIPAAQVQSNWTQTTTTAVDYIKNKPTLATVATSGSYNDLSNKPTIPTVGNATLTIQKNGTNVQTFTANATSNKTANIIVPTKTSDITNDSGFVSTSDVGTVTGTMIADATVGSDKLTANAVWTANIKDAAVTSAKIDWTTMAFGNYSTSEQDTKLTWINGAKIYKKTIVSTDLAAGENNINHGISNLGLVLKYDGLMDLGGGTTLPIPTMASVTNNSVSVWIVNSTVIRIFSSLLFTGTVYITLYYTKTS